MTAPTLVSPDASFHGRPPTPARRFHAHLHLQLARTASPLSQWCSPPSHSTSLVNSSTDAPRERRLPALVRRVEWAVKTACQRCSLFLLIPRDDHESLSRHGHNQPPHTHMIQRQPAYCTRARTSLYLQPSSATRTMTLSPGTVSTCRCTGAHSARCLRSQPMRGMSYAHAPICSHHPRGTRMPAE